MVYLSAGAAELRVRVSGTLAGRDLDAYVTALILATGYSDWRSSHWGREVEELLGTPYTDTARPQDVAIHGVRAFFGEKLPLDYATLIDREIARRPLPPAATIHDDDRILVGIAAGVGRLIPRPQSPLPSPATDASSRSRVLRLWAERLAAGSPIFEAADVPAALRLIREEDARRADDAAALLWLAARMLDSVSLDTSDVETIESRVHDLRKGVQDAEVDAVLPVTVAMVVDAGSATPSERFFRSSTRDRVLGLIDQFQASASVLARRHANRTPFVIEDEYDVQDLFHALVLPIIPDCDPEDSAPKTAAKGMRLDFVSKSTRLGFEMKFVRSQRHADDVREEILLDEATYHSHPSVREVIAFIYDPNHHIVPSVRTLYERDLSTTVTIDGRTVVYHVRVRG
jgi:hypothetical protein